MTLINRIHEKIEQVFSGLQFDEWRHLYYIKNRKGYMEYLPSVSSKVALYVPEFDLARWLPICAKKEGMTESELAYKWQTMNRMACELGTETHKWLERWDGFKTPTTPQQQAGVLFLKFIKDRYVIVCKELRMYHKRYKFAGTCDLLLYDKLTGTLVIADYKTNGDLFKTYDMMNAPFSSLESHSYNHYQIQLSLYQILAEQLRYTMSDRLIIHLSPLGQFTIFNNTYYFEKELKEELKAQLKTKLVA